MEEVIRIPITAAVHYEDNSDFLENLQTLNWREIAALLSEVKANHLHKNQNKKRINRNEEFILVSDSADHHRVLFDEQPDDIALPNPSTRKNMSTSEFEEEKTNLSIEGPFLHSFHQPYYAVHTEEQSGNQHGEVRPRVNQPKPKKKKGMKDDPAMFDALNFEEVRDLLLDAELNKLKDYPQRSAISPVIHPNHGPRIFYVAPKESNESQSMYQVDVKDVHCTAVRLRSTKKVHWFPDDTGLGLRFRELAQKDRKNGTFLDFSGCFYELIRKDESGGISVSGCNIQIFQVWPCTATDLEETIVHSPSSASAFGSPEMRPTYYMQTGAFEQSLIDPLCIPEPTDGYSYREELDAEHQALADQEQLQTGLSEANKICYEIYSKYAEILAPIEFKRYMEMYGSLLESKEFREAIQTYISREDPRLREPFLCPEDMMPVEEYPIGIFRSKIDDLVFSVGGRCFFADETFKAIVGMDPTDMVGFFRTIQSPLHRLCVTRVWWQKVESTGLTYVEYFSRKWNITQGAYTLHNGETKVLRVNNRIYIDKDLGMCLECQAQDVSQLYPDIIKMQPFLA